MEAAIKKFTTKLRVYWSDCDAAGIVYYGNFFRYFEIAEEELYLAQGRSRPEVYYALQVGFPRVEAHCRYYKPARLGDVLETTLWIAHRSSRSMKFHFELRREGETDLVAEGNYAIVCINRQFKPVPFPEELLQLLGDYLPPITHRKAREAVKSE
ncbi:MAG: acyl-CoA thioesterase [Acidobacteria bacterium]|nr:acyl-CoA thioesterase [Acidobacteriota bacterium]